MLVTLWLSMAFAYSIMPIFGQMMESELEVVSKFMFPYHADMSLPVIMSPKDTTYDIHEFVDETIAVDIVTENGTVLDHCKMPIDGRYLVDINYIGEYMTVIDWTKSLAGNNLRIQISFKEKAHGYNLSISQTNSLNVSKVIFKTKIQLKIFTDIELSLTSEDGRKGEVLMNTTGIITCRGYGRPNMPNVNKTLLNVLNYTRKRGQLSVHFFASPNDYMKTIWCQVGNARKSVVIKVLHPPTKLSVMPRFCQKFTPGKNVTCSSVDGYPSPLVQWRFISGPGNSDEYFEIKNTSFLIKKATPKCSQWQIMCVSSNTIDGNLNVYEHLVNFTVQDDPMDTILPLLKSLNVTLLSSLSVIQQRITKLEEFQRNTLVNFVLPLGRNETSLFTIENFSNKCQARQMQSYYFKQIRRYQFILNLQLQSIHQMSMSVSFIYMDQSNSYPTFTADITITIFNQETMTPFQILSGTVQFSGHCYYGNQCSAHGLRNTLPSFNKLLASPGVLLNDTLMLAAKISLR